MTGVDPFDSSLAHLLAELKRIDLLIQRQVQRFRESRPLDDHLRGLYITEDEIDRILAQPTGSIFWENEDGPPAGDLPERIEKEIREKKEAGLRQGIELRLATLSRNFQLDALQTSALLVALAPELDLRYERLYAFLHDDVTRKYPTVDLILNLLCPTFEEKLQARRYFSQESALVKFQLLHLAAEPSHPHSPLLAHICRADARVIDYLLAGNDSTETIAPYGRVIEPRHDFAELLLPSRLKEDLRRWLASRAPGTSSDFLYFCGPKGAGKQAAAEALGRSCGRKLLVVDCTSFLDLKADDLPGLLRRLSRESILCNAIPYWRDLDRLQDADQRHKLEACLRELEECKGAVVLAGETPLEPGDRLHGQAVIRVDFAAPDYKERLQLWHAALHECPAGHVEAVAGTFKLTGGQIRDAAASVRSLAAWRDPERPEITEADLREACRQQSNRKLASLAQKISPRYSWQDIILPAPKLQQLREILNAARLRPLVYGEWGFDRKLSLGKGLNVLFSGPSGTGKTMASEILAGEMGLDLYKIDLSTVVSKYIGETEKNLSRIFAEAETANAVLFFDEADALFGKRSEVRDAHDRYANIETGYLLQKMEEYDGIVVLATNLSRNMDEAFVRRIHFIMDFPFPSGPERYRIWEKIWPAGAPLGADLDFGFLAKRFEITGGNVKNIALAAAFLAAEEGMPIGMTHLARATQRELRKIGKVAVDGEFGEYWRLAAGS